MIRLLIVAVCFVVGYWLVMRLLNAADAKNREEAAKAPPNDGVTKDLNERVTLSNWFRILDVPENAGREQIEAAYRQKIAQYHPDKVAQLGLEIREVAEAKSRQINIAYELGMRRWREVFGG